MLLELAVGDAYGAGFEYAREMIAKHNDLSFYVKHPTHHIVPGCYTDDTQQTLAIVELILSGEPWTPFAIASKLVEVFKRDEREGYSGNTYAFLKRVDGPRTFLEEIQPESDKSGAAMRAVPIGVYETIDEVLEKSMLQAEVTHRTRDGILAAQAAALMGHYFVHSLGPKRELGVFLEKHVPGYDWATPWRGKVKSKGWMSTWAATTAIIEHDDLATMLRACVDLTGDVDTVATIAMGAASCSPEVENNLPENLIYGLEDRTYGRSYLLELDAALMDWLEDREGVTPST